MARANGVPAFVFGYKSTVRGALGFGLMPLLAVAEKLGIVGSKADDVEEAAILMEHMAGRIGEHVPLKRNHAKHLAAEAAGPPAGGLRRRHLGRGGAPLEDTAQREQQALVLLGGTARG